MNEDKLNKSVLSMGLCLLILLIAFNFYLIGYLRDYGVYNYKHLFNLNLIALPMGLLWYLYLKFDFRKIKFVLYPFLIALSILNIYFTIEAKKTIFDYEVGYINYAKLMKLKESYVGRVYFFRDDCPHCRNLTEKIREYNKKTEDKILMYNTNSDFQNKEKVIKEYNIVSVPMVIVIDGDGKVQEITSEFEKFE